MPSSERYDCCCEQSCDVAVHTVCLLVQWKKIIFYI